MIDIITFFKTQPEDLHKIIHIMRISQQKIYDLTIENKTTVIGTGMQFYQNLFDVPATDYIVSSDNNRTIVMGYEILDDPISDDDIHTMREFLDNIIRIDDDFSNVTEEDILSLDLTRTEFV